MVTLKQASKVAVLSILATAMVAGAPVAGAQVILFDNGGFITSTGTGVGGADESVMQELALGDQTLGVAHSTADAFIERVADQFTIPGPDGWTISAARFYAYEVGSGTTSTISSINLQIWDGDPSMVGSLVVFGDVLTNRLLSSGWTNAYRVSQSTSGSASTRPVMEAETSVGVFLGPGTYWIDWQTEGGGTEMLAVPVTVAGQAVTGDAIQFSNAGGDAWSPVMDSGSGSEKGLAFVLEGEMGGSPNTLEVPISLAGLLTFGSLLGVIGLIILRKLS